MTPAATTGRPGAGLLIEAGFLAAILVGIGVCALSLKANGFLPPPFVYDAFDTFMDWYNTAYWANNPGAYDLWGSIYPPLSFVFLRVFSLHACYGLDPFVARDCDGLGRLTLLALFAANVVIVFQSYRLSDPRTAPIRAAAVCLGLPMLYALDRGNLIIPCFTAFALGHGRLLRSARLKWLAIALAANFKPYLLAALVSPLLKRRWRWFEGCAVACALIYLLSYAAFGAGTPGELLRNIGAYQLSGGNDLFGALFYGASYSSILNFLQRGLPLMSFVGSRPLETMSLVLPIAMRVGQAGLLAAFLAAALRPQAVSAHRLAALGVVGALTTVEVGGYAEVFLLFLVFLEPWRGASRIVALVAAYLLCIPADFALATVAHEIRTSYLTHRVVELDLSVSLGMIVRPGLVLVIQYALCFATLVAAAKAGPPNAVRAARPAPPSTALQRA